MKIKVSMYIIAIAIFSVSTSLALAHFPWLVRENDGRLSYYFGEDLVDRTYQLPASLVDVDAVTYIDGGQQPTMIELQPVKEKDFVGLRSSKATNDGKIYMAQATYGVHRNSRLEYYSIHYAGGLPQERAASLAKSLDLNAELYQDQAGISCFISWKGQSLEGVEVRLLDSQGRPKSSSTSDAKGHVSFADSLVEGNGLCAIMLGHQLLLSGTLKDQTYGSESHYLTVTFELQVSPATEQATESADRQMPDLPIEVTSFGAVRQGQAIYVYGGHTGAAHSYSNEAQNQNLYRLNLDHTQAGWEKVATGPKLQGLGMVAHGDWLILIGGFTAINATGQEADLRSQSSVHAYNVTTMRWSELPALPAARSSHDAALIGDSIYVVGGWNMQGPKNTTWHKTACTLNLADSNPQWTEIANPPFSRRALAVVAHAGKLFAIGGMNEQGGPTRDVAVYDPATRVWDSAGQLQGEKAMAGFGAAAWSIDQRLIATTYEGSIQQWDDDSKTWQQLGQTQDARFFHRMLPFPEKNLVSIGGASMDEGKFTRLEIIPISQ